MTKNIGRIIVLLIVLALGIYGVKSWMDSDNRQTQQESQVLLEQVKAVTKLVTTEGYFSEIFSEVDTKSYFGFPSTKKVLIKVKAKVSAGFNLGNMKIEADHTTKTLRLSNIPPPEIISIEPEISYYDIANGVFNTFTNDDYTRLNKRAVEIVREQALKSDFMNNVNEQGQRNFDALRILAESMGWKFEIEGSSFAN
jgi:type II secretory pathway pseudopilin PulG